MSPPVPRTTRYMGTIVRQHCHTIPIATLNISRLKWRDVRERAGLGPYAGSTDSEDLRREIFNERDRELFGEGQRYFDIVRNGYLDRLSEAYQQLTAKDIENGALYRPVAQRSFNNNELMTQNKYWLWRR